MLTQILLGVSHALLLQEQCMGDAASRCRFPPISELLRGRWGGRIKHLFFYNASFFVPVEFDARNPVSGSTE